MKHFYIATCLAIFLTACSSQILKTDDRPSAQAFASCGVTDAEMKRLHALSVNEFDQDMTGGWRSVSEQDGCKSIAGYVIEDYIAAKNIEPNSDDYVLYWHAGQMHAGANNYSRAKSLFSKSYSPNLSVTDTGYEWSLYAKGTIAFLDNDRGALQSRIDDIAAIPIDPEEVAAFKQLQIDNTSIRFPEGFPEKSLNLIALEGLMQCFGKPYSEAYGGKCDAP